MNTGALFLHPARKIDTLVGVDDEIKYTKAKNEIPLGAILI